MLKKTILFALFISAVLFNCIDNHVEGITVVSPEEMQILLDLQDVQLIDVRTKEEHLKDHLVNSQNIDINSPTFDEDIVNLDKNKPVVLYCQKGGRSAKCARKMKAAGFKKIYDLEGGFSKWSHVKHNFINLKS